MPERLGEYQEQVPLIYDKAPYELASGSGILSGEVYTFRHEGAGPEDPQLRMRVMTSDRSGAHLPVLTSFKVISAGLERRKAADGYDEVMQAGPHIDLSMAVSGELDQEDRDFVAGQLAALQFQVSTRVAS